MDGLRKPIAVLALLVIIMAFTAPAMAQMNGAPMVQKMPKASPTMMPTAKPMMGQGMQGGMMPMQVTTSNKDMMSTMQGMSDLSMAMSMMKAMGVDQMMKPGQQHTMFVPSDMALQKMGMDKTKMMDKINMMMKDKQMAMNIMKGHMMDRLVMPSDMKDGMMLTMMNGQTMKVTMSDGQMMIDGAKVTKAVQTTDGMLYVLDNIPSSMMSMMQMGAGSTGTAPMSM